MRLRPAAGIWCFDFRNFVEKLLHVVCCWCALIDGVDGEIWWCVFLLCFVTLERLRNFFLERGQRHGRWRWSSICSGGSCSQVRFFISWFVLFCYPLVSAASFYPQNDGNYSVNSSHQATKLNLVKIVSFNYFQDFNWFKIIWTVIWVLRLTAIV